MILSGSISYKDAYQQISRFVDEMNPHKRIHLPLGYPTTVEFAVRWNLTNQERFVEMRGAA